MIVLKCKMCGGNLHIAEGASTTECEYCGCMQTVPKMDDEKKLIQFERAESLRKQCEFDKAAGIYESIVADFRHEAEAYWGLVLCKYGIEYVDDPATGKKIPTCHRSSFESILDDSDFEQAMENADSAARRVYREEAKQFERIRKGILEVSSTEQPYDIFICYKETDEKGDRTLDSVLAQDLYSELTDKGYRVFFSRITLRGKLGEAYEPYIFAALHSAKVMLAVGTCYEHYNAVWVKNEWSRYLKLCREDKSKHLIPCYKGIDPEDIPREFNHLQGADLGKMGAVQDILFNMEKYVPLLKATAIMREQISEEREDRIAPLLKRVSMFLEDEEWDRADAFCEQILNIDPENAQAYLGKLLAECKVKKQEDLQTYTKSFEESNNYQKALRFADEALKKTLTGICLERTYKAIKGRMDEASTEAAYKELVGMLSAISGYKDADALLAACEKKLDSIRAVARKRAKSIKITVAVLLAAACLSIGVYFLITGWFVPNGQYNDALDLMDAGKYEEAIASFEALDAFRDSKQKIQECYTGILDDQYDSAVALMNAGKYKEAIDSFKALGKHRDSKEKKVQCEDALYKSRYDAAVQLEAGGKKAEAAMAFYGIADYRDAGTKSRALWNSIADRHTISAHGTVALKANGSVMTTENSPVTQQAVDSWQNIIAISASWRQIVGLKADGTVVIDRKDDLVPCDTSLWRDVVAISAGYSHVVGLKADGTVMATGNNDDGQCDVSAWRDIVAISAGECHTVGLKADGTVVATGNNDDGQCNVSAWRDIVAISAGYAHTVGLKADGTVVAAGWNDMGQCDVSAWRNIVAVSAGSGHTIGLKANGTAVAVGENFFYECSVGGWQDIVAISAGGQCSMGLKANGTVVYNGMSIDVWETLDSWENIKVP